MSSNYEKLLRILRKWPQDPNRKTRDYGIVLRKLVEENSLGGNPFAGTTEENARKLESLRRITDNTYGKMYPPNIKVGATGMHLKDLNKCLGDAEIQKFKRISIKSL